MRPDLSSEEALRAVPSVSRKRPLSLCILGSRLREVRLFSTFNITLGTEILTTKKKIKLLVFFCILAWFPFLWCSVIRCTLALIFCHAPSPLFTQYTYHDRVFTPLKNRLQVQHELKSDEQIDWELELRTFLCDSHIYKCLSQAEEYRFEDLSI